MVKAQEVLFDYLPSDETLEEVLGKIFAQEFSGATNVSLLMREKNIYTSTHPSEVIKCLFPGNVERKLFLKFEIESFSEINDHRNDLKYETKVYTEVLSHIGMSTPKYYGSYTFEKHKLNMLVIEYLSDLVKFSKSKDEPNIILKAARWLAEFHNKSKEVLLNNGLAFMHRYDEEYYMKWPGITIDRIFDFNLEKQYTWLLELVEQYHSSLKEMTAVEQVVIHGEFYPTNVRYARRTLYPLDWQTAALSPGEIDIASLTHYWPDKNIQELARQEYFAARDLDEPVEKFNKRITLATIYLDFLWLRYSPEVLMDPTHKGSKFLNHLRDLKALL